MVYELFLGIGKLSRDDWENFFANNQKMHHDFSRWSLALQREGSILRFFILSDLPLPSCLDGFYLRPIASSETSQNFEKNSAKKSGFVRVRDYATLDNFMKLRRGGEIQSAKIDIFGAFANTYSFGKIYNNRGGFRLVGSVFDFLALDFEKSRQYCKKSIPKVLDSAKILPLLQNSTSSQKPLAHLDLFPYSGEKNLNIADFNLDKHSLILGSSGSGKSKFISLLVERVFNDEKMRKKYNFLIIDPHGALYRDIGGLCKVINFEKNAIKLLESAPGAPISSVELLLDVFRNLLGSGWNSRLERVLRHSFYALNVKNCLSFANLKRLLLDLNFRNALLEEDSMPQNNTNPALPNSARSFFLTEYNEIKTKNYSEAIDPIIGLIDEIEMLPVFAKSDSEGFTYASLGNLLSENTLISLDKSRLGARSVKIISDFITAELMSVLQKQPLDKKLICIIDEVATVENPILPKILSEGRKFGVSLYLAGQYFGAMSKDLQTGIFANCSNYYIFRVARDDAITLSQSLDIKLVFGDSDEKRIELLEKLNNRECVLRLSINERLMTAFCAKTADFAPIPEKNQNIERMFNEIEPKFNEVESKNNKIESGFNENKPEKVIRIFSIRTDYVLEDLLKISSANIYSLNQNSTKLNADSARLNKYSMNLNDNSTKNIEQRLLQKLIKTGDMKL